MSFHRDHLSDDRKTFKRLLIELIDSTRDIELTKIRRPRLQTISQPSE